LTAECTKLSDKPSIAVLAFQNLSGDPEQDCFADSIAENVIMLLSHFHSLFVVASSSSFTFKGQTVDVTQIAKLLSVRYVVQGGVRKAGDRVRITAQLIDSTSGKHLWADRFDGSLDDVFDLQVRITEQIVVAVEPETTRLLEGTKLERGAHHSRERGMCAMELVAYIAGEEHSYAPACASDLLTGFTIRLNDSMRQAERENLKPFLPRLVGTNQGDERRRFEAMTRTVIARLLVPILERRGAPLLATRLQQRSLTSLGSLAVWLRGLQKGDTDLRLDVVLPRDIRQALWNAVEAADRVRDGSQPNWNWCGGELGIAVADAIGLAGDENWAVALQALEAGIDACSADQFGTSSRPSDGSDLTWAAQYVCI
jgi:TolB-like protein